LLNSENFLESLDRMVGLCCCVCPLQNRTPVAGFVGAALTLAEVATASPRLHGTAALSKFAV
jgi:hypothetical protein